MILTQPILPLQVGVGPRIRHNSAPLRIDLHLASCNFIALKRVIKFLLLYHSLIHFCRLHSLWQEHNPLSHQQVSWYECHLLYAFLKHMAFFWWLILFFFISGFFIFSLRLVICKKYTNTNSKDSKHTNTIDISIIWPYCRLYCRLYFRLLRRLYHRLYWRLYWLLFCRLFFAMQYFFLSFFHKCSKLIALGDASRMFFSCYIFLLFFCHFLFNTKSTRKNGSNFWTSCFWFG